MLERLPRGKRNLALALLAALLILFIWKVQAVLNPLFLAYIIAWIVHPMVLRLEGRGWTRMKAVNVIYGVTILLVLVGGLGFWIQGSALMGRVLDKENGLLQDVDDSIGEFLEADWIRAIFPDDDVLPDEALAEGEAGELAETQGEELDPPEGGSPPDGGDQGALSDSGDSEAGSKLGDEPDEVAAAIEEPKETWETVDFLRGLASKGSEGRNKALVGAGSAVTHWFGSIIGFFSMLVLLPIYTWYLLFELERIHAGVRKYIPSRERERVSRIARQIGDVLTNFFRGRVVVCALKGVFLSVGLLLAGVPYALFLGFVSGFASLIPFVGAFLGFAFSFIVSLVAPEASFVGNLVIVSVVFGAAEIIEGYVLVPRILGDSLGLHPLFVFVAIFIGGATLGMFGFLIALPLAAAGMILVRELVVPALQQFAEEDPEGEDPKPKEGAPPIGEAPSV
jgi:predicted PurR-regulated permease PerM